VSKITAAFLIYGMSNLVITNDFGLGDQIQYWRYMPIAASQYNLRVALDEELLYLLQGRGVRVYDKRRPVPELDLMEGEVQTIHMRDLPEFLGEEVDGRGYLPPNLHLTGEYPDLGKFSGFKIGVCWAGNQFNPRDHERSILVELFEDAFSDIPAKFFSLQKQFDPPDLFRDMRLFMSDFNDTAWLMMGLDLVVTVDTAVAHLAGAMGKRCLMLLGTEQDVRWPVEGRKTPLYDSLTLFHQRGRDWSEVLEEVAEEIREILITE
jgi:hypothetical protein